MLHELRQFISEKQLFSPNEKILVTVSGGIDSIVLFDLFLKAGFSFAVAHCNFCLRGEESDKDEQFVSDLAILHGVSFHVKRFDTSSFATNNALSIQMAARELRYAWFEELAKTFKYDRIATAHQLNDIIETTLINLSRGTGIAGLHGIPEKNGNIIRPLLFSSRNSIRAYAEESQLTWREDSSNIEEKYARNLIRHQVVPALKKLNPNLEDVFKQNTERFKGTEQLFKHHIQQYRKELLVPILNGHSISIISIDATPAPFTILTELLLPFGFNFATIQTIYKNRFQASGANYYSPTFLLQKDRQDWLLTPIEQITEFAFTVYPESTLTVPTGSIHFQTINIETFKGFSNAQNIAYIDADKIDWPLTIRNWQDGDKFYPFGMQGMKKVSDFLIDLKVPVSQKKKIPILINKGEILWIVGFRTDKMYKITDSTKKILIATFTPLIQELDNII
jgi:tRNA(Ile)-lysidine synthase